MSDETGGDEADKILERVRRRGQISREAHKEVINNHIDASERVLDNQDRIAAREASQAITELAKAFATSPDPT